MSRLIEVWDLKDLADEAILIKDDAPCSGGPYCPRCRVAIAQARLNDRYGLPHDHGDGAIRLFVAGSLAAAPAIGFTKAPPKNWHCLIGGNRSGKSTKAAKMVSSHRKIEIASFETSHSARLAADLLPSKNIGDLRLAGKEWHSQFQDHRKAISVLNEGNKWALWIDEVVPDAFVEEVADLYDMVVLSSWPADGLQDSFFYQECLKMGTVENMQMLPHIRKQINESEYSSVDRLRRIEGKFA